MVVAPRAIAATRNSASLTPVNFRFPSPSSPRAPDHRNVGRSGLQPLPNLAGSDVLMMILGHQVRAPERQKMGQGLPSATERSG